ncbi:hypothetical protein YC2023_020379 [Brassica napus]
MIQTEKIRESPTNTTPQSHIPNIDPKGKKKEWRVYTYSTGSKQHLYINHPEMVKELTQINTLNLASITKRLEPILGNGVITFIQWSSLPTTKLRSYFFSFGFSFITRKFRGMIGSMVDSAMQMLRKWEEMVERGGKMGCEIRVAKTLRMSQLMSSLGFASEALSSKEKRSSL